MTETKKKGVPCLGTQLLDHGLRVSGRGFASRGNRMERAFLETSPCSPKAIGDARQQCNCVH